MRENLDDEITEVKSENAIDRITSQANPRTLERVPAGARFHVRMVLDVLCEEDKASGPADRRPAPARRRRPRRRRLARQRSRALRQPGKASGAARHSIPPARRKSSCSKRAIPPRSRPLLRRTDFWRSSPRTANASRAAGPPAAHRAVAHRSDSGAPCETAFTTATRSTPPSAGRWRARHCSTNGWRPPRSGRARRALQFLFPVSPGDPARRLRRSLWPPPASSRSAGKARAFVPMSLIAGLLAGKPVAKTPGWSIGDSECLMPVDRR